MSEYVPSKSKEYFLIPYIAIFFFGFFAIYSIVQTFSGIFIAVFMAISGSVILNISLIVLTKNYLNRELEENDEYSNNKIEYLYKEIYKAGYKEGFNSKDIISSKSIEPDLEMMKSQLPPAEAEINQNISSDVDQELEDLRKQLEDQ